VVRDFDVGVRMLCYEEKAMGKLVSCSISDVSAIPIRHLETHFERYQQR